MVLQIAILLLVILLSAFVGFWIGDYGRDEAVGLASSANYHRGYERGYGAGHGKGYSVGREAAGKTAVTPKQLTHTATIIRQARLPWMTASMLEHRHSYQAAYDQILNLGRQIGDRYMDAEVKQESVAVAVADALNLVTCISSVTRQFEDKKIMCGPHQGSWMGRVS